MHHTEYNDSRPYFLEDPPDLVPAQAPSPEGEAKQERGAVKATTLTFSEVEALYGAQLPSPRPVATSRAAGGLATAWALSRPSWYEAMGHDPYTLGDVYAVPPPLPSPARRAHDDQDAPASDDYYAPVDELPGETLADVSQRVQALEDVLVSVENTAHSIQDTVVSAENTAHSIQESVDDLCRKVDGMQTQLRRTEEKLDASVALSYQLVVALGRQQARSAEVERELAKVHLFMAILINSLCGVGATPPAEPGGSSGRDAGLPQGPPASCVNPPGLIPGDAPE